MADHTRNALDAAVRALQEVIIPAVDPSHPLALEQAKIVTGLLKLLAERFEYTHARARFEVLHAADLARSLRADAASAAPSIAAEIDAALDVAQRLADDPAARSHDLASASMTLTALASATVRATAGTPVADRVERTVLAGSKRYLDLQRAWFLPQGWETDPTVVPSLDDALAAVR